MNHKKEIHLSCHENIIGAIHISRYLMECLCFSEKYISPSLQLQWLYNQSCISLIIRERFVQKKVICFILVGLTWVQFSANFTNRAFNIFSLNFPFEYPSFTNYRCILITGVFRFPQITIVWVIITWNFPPNIVYNTFFFHH